MHEERVEFVEPKTDEGNKELVIDSFACRLSVAFTGRAEIGGSEVGSWVMDTIRKTNAAAIGIMECAKAIRAEANAEYSSLVKPRATDLLEFVLTGFMANEEAPMVITVSNFRTDEFKTIEPQRTFNILRPSNRERPFWPAGYTPAMDPDVGRRVHALLKRKQGHMRVADTLVREIRRAADHPEYGHWIGRSCMSVCIPRWGSGRSYYYSGSSEPISYGPAVLQVRRNPQGEPWHMSAMGIETNAVQGEVIFGEDSLSVVDRRRFPRTH
jgi:hypothetical protein